MFELVFETMQQNPLYLMAGLYLLFQLWNVNKGDFPADVPGSKVRRVRSLKEFNEVVEECAKSGAVVVVDYFAVWCPPCRKAAPVFGELSKDFSGKDVVFVKVDVDEAREVAKEHEVKAMPTFKVFNGANKVVSTLRGWNEKKLRDIVEKAASAK
eukprot:CAMPEP_0184547624 /NCGR_PEP_ID=MMETSP0199_2-20130426/5694_1 /TAXON_ID=1112570 /ORGANISM="Thraustochytrium sp., Strain LLF1b" /LENGTH=154 /DNA_ID=CAMNT_0026942141 /DNA_START=212 /DNA_END=676 /DNA_ORIENTATION=+